MWAALHHMHVVVARIEMCVWMGRPFVAVRHHGWVVRSGINNPSAAYLQ